MKNQRVKTSFVSFSRKCEDRLSSILFTTGIENPVKIISRVISNPVQTEINVYVRVPLNPRVSVLPGIYRVGNDRKLTKGLFTRPNRRQLSTLSDR